VQDIIIFLQAKHTMGHFAGIFMSQREREREREREKEREREGERARVRA
jgi:hypothetical protein